MRSSVQIIYSAATGLDLDSLIFGEVRCRLCGGPLLEPSEEDPYSDSWTDEYSLADRSSPRTCAACVWLLRNRLWLSSSRSLVARPGSYDSWPSLAGLARAVLGGLSYPCVLACWGPDRHKHVFLRSAVSYSDSALRVLCHEIFGSWVFVCEFPAEWFSRGIEKLVPSAREAAGSFKKPKASLASVSFYAAGELLRKMPDSLKLDPRVRFLAKCAADLAAEEVLSVAAA